MNFFKKYFILILILILGFAVRIYHLDTLPPGLTWDEAALGYNAYSILKTARDEHGAFLPIIFKSFGDYKPGLYVYLDIPFVALFGLNEISTRLPSAIFGTLSILGVYLLSQLLFGHLNIKHLKFICNLEFDICHFSAFVLALNPWSLHFSRSAWEVNVFSCFLIFAIYFFLKFLDNKNNFSLWPSLILAVLTLFLYQAAKMLTPLIFIALILINFKNFYSKIKTIFSHRFDLIIFIFSLLAIFYVYFGIFFSSSGNRLATQNLLGYRPPVSQEELITYQNNPILISIFRNQFVFSARLFFSRYLYHFSPEVLFYEGPVIIQRGHIPGLGAFYITDALLIVFGFIFLSRFGSRISRNILLSILFLAPIPASLTLSEFSTVRSLFLSLPLSILAGLGLYFIFSNLPKIISLIIFSFYLLNIALGLDLYFNHSLSILTHEFNYGYKQAIQAIKEQPTSKVVFTDVYGQPYIYYLFYTQFDPRAYQKLNSFEDGGVDVGKVSRINSVEFHQFSLDETKTAHDTLFIGSEGNIPIKTDHQISFPNGDPIFRIIKT